MVVGYLSCSNRSASQEDLLQGEREAGGGGRRRHCQQFKRQQPPKPQPHLDVEAQPLGCAAECLPQRRDAVCPSEGDGEAWSTQHLTHRPMRKQRPASAAVAVCTATAWLQSPTGEEPACRCHPRVRRSCRAACRAAILTAAAAAGRGRQRRLGGSGGGALKLRLEDAASHGGWVAGAGKVRGQAAQPMAPSRLTCAHHGVTGQKHKRSCSCATIHSTPENKLQAPQPTRSL